MNIKRGDRVRVQLPRQRHAWAGRVTDDGYANAVTVEVTDPGESMMLPGAQVICHEETMTVIAGGDEREDRSEGGLRA